MRSKDAMSNHTDILTSFSWRDEAGRIHHGLGRLCGFRPPTNVILLAGISPDEEPKTLEIELGEKDLEVLRRAVENRLREMKR
jgi:hypothetical protein